MCLAYFALLHVLGSGNDTELSRYNWTHCIKFNGEWGNGLEIKHVKDLGNWCNSLILTGLALLLSAVPRGQACQLATYATKLLHAQLIKMTAIDITHLILSGGTSLKYHSKPFPICTAMLVTVRSFLKSQQLGTVFLCTSQYIFVLLPQRHLTALPVFSTHQVFQERKSSALPHT